MSVEVAIAPIDTVVGLVQISHITYYDKGERMLNIATRIRRSIGARIRRSTEAPIVLGDLEQ